MKPLAHVVIGAFALLLTSPAFATDAKVAESLAQRNGCLACHTVNEKVVGPALKDVAAKYRGEKGAEAKLIGRVKSGSSGVWGPVPMWPNSPQVKDEDIRVIVQWILTL